MYQVTLLNKNSEAEVKELLSLLQISFNNDLDYYLWKHNLNEKLKIEEYTFCVFHNELCIATTQVIINEIIISRKKHRFGLLCDGATHKDYRRLGLFEKLLSHINEFCSKKAVDFVYSTGNEKSRKALLKLGFKDFFTTLKASKRIRYTHPTLKLYNAGFDILSSLRRNKYHDVREISIKEYVSFYESHKDNYSITFRKTVAYLEWRLKETSGSYTIYAVTDSSNSIKAIVVLKSAGQTLQIVDFMHGEDFNYVNRLVSFASYLASKNKSVVRIICSHNNFKGLKESFESNNFKISQEGSNTLIYVLNPEFKIPYAEMNNMQYMRIDKNE